MALPNVSTLPIGLVDLVTGDDYADRRDTGSTTSIIVTEHPPYICQPPAGAIIPGETIEREPVSNGTGVLVNRQEDGRTFRGVTSAQNLVAGLVYGAPVPGGFAADWVLFTVKDTQWVDGHETHLEVDVLWQNRANGSTVGIVEKKTTLPTGTLFRVDLRQEGARDSPITRELLIEHAARVSLLRRIDTLVGHAIRNDRVRDIPDLTQFLADKGIDLGTPRVVYDYDATLGLVKPDVMEDTPKPPAFLYPGDFQRLVEGEEVEIPDQVWVTSTVHLPITGITATLAVRDGEMPNGRGAVESHARSLRGVSPVARVDLDSCRIQFAGVTGTRIQPGAEDTLDAAEVEEELTSYLDRFAEESEFCSVYESVMGETGFATDRERDFSVNVVVHCSWTVGSPSMRTDESIGKDMPDEVDRVETSSLTATGSLDTTLTVTAPTGEAAAEQVTVDMIVDHLYGVEDLDILDWTIDSVEEI